MNKKRLGSVGVILAGLVAILVLSNGTDAVLEATGVFPSVAVQRERGFDTTWMVALALVFQYGSPAVAQRRQIGELHEYRSDPTGRRGRHPDEPSGEI